MFTVSVSHGALRALALLAGDGDDGRTCLASICIDTTTPGRVHLVSTDGHRMLIVGNAELIGEREAGRYLVPLWAVKASKHGGTDRYPKPTRIDIAPDRSYAIHGRETQSGYLLGEQFPEWRRVIPTKRDFQKPGKLAHFDWGYLGDFARVAELIGAGKPQILHNGEKGAIVFLGSAAFGVLMPIRVGYVEADAPFVDWFDAPAVAAEQVAA